MDPVAGTNGNDSIMPKLSKLHEWTQKLWPMAALSLLMYVMLGGRFGAQAGRQALFVLAVGLSCGVPLLWLFRVIICRLAFWSQARGYGATTVGIILSFTLLVALALVIPARIGMACLPLGLLGGIRGSLEAKDKRDAFMMHPQRRARRAA